MTGCKNFFQAPALICAHALAGAIRSGRTLYFLCILLCAHALAADPERDGAGPDAGESARENVELVVNGGFEADSTGWRKSSFPQLREGRNGGMCAFLNDRMRILTQHIGIPSGTASVRVSFSYMAENIAAGEKPAETGGLSITFLDASGNRTGDPQEGFRITGSAPWSEFETTYDVPGNAATLRIDGYMQGKSGILMLDDISVKVNSGPSGNPSLPERKIKRSAPGSPGEELIKNGDFENGSEGWRKDSFPPAESDGNGGRFAVLSNAMHSVSQNIPIPQNAYSLKVALRYNAVDIVQGEEAWHDGRLAMMFTDGDGRMAGKWPEVFHISGSSGGWKTFERVYNIPPEAAALKIDGYMRGRSGTLMLDDISVTIAETLARPEDLPCPIDEAAAMPPVSASLHEKNAARERICLNGLWRFYPAYTPEKKIPEDGAGWGWFKVPGIWPSQDAVPGISQQFCLPAWQKQRGAGAQLKEAWYERGMEVPSTFLGKRVILDVEWLQSFAEVYVNGEKAGEITFPGGRLDITDAVKIGVINRIAIRLLAIPLSEEQTVIMDSDAVFKNKDELKLRGITGDVFLIAEPADAGIADAVFKTDGVKKSLSACVSFGNPPPEKSSVRIDIYEKGVKKHSSAPASVPGGAKEIWVSTVWRDALAWDTDNPNLYEAAVVLLGPDGGVLDETFREPFGFRTFSISGRDFMLNGRPIHLRALLADNANRGADAACSAGAAATFAKMKEYGFNACIMGNYNFRPGTTGYIKSMLDEADKAGIIVSFSLPHGADFGWKTSDAGTLAAYESLTRKIIGRIKNHPSVALYAVNHNQCAYAGDLNPLAMDGVVCPEKAGTLEKWSRRPMASELEKIIKKIDGTRPVYHHSSGNLGDVMSNNIYLNWSPERERDDWIAHWANHGVKPLFFVEWGMPHIASWSSYRGPGFIWRTRADQCVWLSEFAAETIGPDAYKLTDAELAVLEHEGRLWAQTGKPAWGDMCRPLRKSDIYREITARYLKSNWRSFRAYGLSACLPWDQEIIADPAETRRPEPLPNPDRFSGFGRPGIIPDNFTAAGNFLYSGFSGEKFTDTRIGRVFREVNMPAAAWIAGAPCHFTEKSSCFAAGETVEKQLAVSNDSRSTATVRCSWRTEPLDGPASASGLRASGSEILTAEPGETVFAPISFTIPSDAPGGRFRLSAQFESAQGKTADSFDFSVLPFRAPIPLPEVRTALYDPSGDTAAELDRMGVKYSLVEASDSLAGFDRFVIGRGALSSDAVFPGASRVRDGLDLIIFEQTPEALERRFGFRTNAQGLRRLFAAAPQSEILRDMDKDAFCEWRGESTTLPSYIAGASLEQPTAEWAGFENTRVWRNGNWGNVAHSLIELPEAGNITPVLTGGFDMQYAALLESREGRGRITLCQLEVTGRSLLDPAAVRIKENLFARPLPSPAGVRRVILLRGGKHAAEFLDALRIQYEIYDGGEIPPESVIVAETGSEIPDSLHRAVKNGAYALGLGLNAGETKSFTGGLVPVAERTGPPEAPPGAGSGIFAGVPASGFYVHSARIKYAALELDGGKHAFAEIPDGSGAYVMLQIAPWLLDYQNPDLGFLRTSFRRNTHMVSQVLRNLGAVSGLSLSDLLSAPVKIDKFKLPELWRGMPAGNNGELSGEWHMPDFDDSAWRTFRVPGTFNSQYGDLSGYLGVFVYRLRFDRPPKMTSDEASLYLGPIDDESSVWLNGRFLGEVTRQSNPNDCWSVPRQYKIKLSELNETGNVIAVKVNNTYLSGGMLGKPEIRSDAKKSAGFYLQEPTADDDPYRFYRW